MHSLNYNVIPFLFYMRLVLLQKCAKENRKIFLWNGV